MRRTILQVLPHTWALKVSSLDPIVVEIKKTGPHSPRRERKERAYEQYAAYAGMGRRKPAGCCSSPPWASRPAANGEPPAQSHRAGTCRSTAAVRSSLGMCGRRKEKKREKKNLTRRLSRRTATRLVRAIVCTLTKATCPPPCHTCTKPTNQPTPAAAIMAMAMLWY